jgi:hypothetical protein
MASTITAGNATNGLGISSDNTGILQLKSGTGAGTTALTLDASQNVTVAGTLAAGAITATGTVSAPSIQITGVATNIYPLMVGTAVASTSGSSIDFTGIPAYVKRVTVLFNGVSTNGSTALQIRLGDATGISATGYLSSSTQIVSSATTTSTNSSLSTTGFELNDTSTVSTTRVGTMVFSLFEGTTWIASGNFGTTNAASSTLVNGSKVLTSALTQLRITASATAFDAGSINIMWE